MATADDHRIALHQLLPPGDALGGEDIDALLDALSQEMGRFEQRMVDLLNEADLRDTNELLSDWETAYGLPDECTTASPEVQQRRISLVGRENSDGGQSIAYFTQLAANLGYAVTIDEFRPLRSGFRAGDPCSGLEWASTWRVNVLSGATSDLSGLVRFRAGSGRSGDRLGTFGASDLECVISRAAPAHTTVIFAYPEA